MKQRLVKGIRQSLPKGVVSKVEDAYRTARVHALSAQYGHPARSLRVIAVTGTNGKTTVATLLYKVARGLGYSAGHIGTVEILINDKEFKLDKKIPFRTIIAFIQ